MPLSNPITSFGIHQATIIDRTTHEQFALKVLGDFSPELVEEMIKLYGGSNSYPWDTAPGNAESNISFTVKQYELPVWRYFAGDGPNSAVEDANGDVAGAVTALTNLVGTSLANPTTGLAAPTIVAATNPKFGEYLVKAASPTTVNVYLDNDLDGVAYVDDSLKITASPLTITTGAATVIPGTGIELNGGSGTIGLTASDIARFSAKPINNYNYDYYLGAAGASKKEFGLRVFMEKLDGNKYRTMYFPRVKANGISPTSPEKDFSTFETELTVLYDAALGYAGRMQVIGR